MEPKPSMGRIVHFVDENGAEWPAIILRVDKDCVSLHVMTEDGNYGLADVPYGEVRVPGAPPCETWHWPEREQPARELTSELRASEPRIDPELSAALVSLLGDLRDLVTEAKKAVADR